MSPYMRAYEAGIKLAQAEFFGKYAFDPEAVRGDVPADTSISGEDSAPEPAATSIVDMIPSPILPEEPSSEVAAPDRKEQIISQLGYDPDSEPEDRGFFSRMFGGPTQRELDEANISMTRPERMSEDEYANTRFYGGIPGHASVAGMKRDIMGDDYNTQYIPEYDRQMERYRGAQYRKSLIDELSNLRKSNNPSANTDSELAAPQAADNIEAGSPQPAPAPAAEPVAEPAQASARKITSGPITGEEAPPREYFEAQGGYGRMARNLRDMYQSKMDALYDTQLPDEEFEDQMSRYENMLDLSGRELSQMYGNQALQAGDQLDLTDLQDRYRALQSSTDDDPYKAAPVTVMRRGRERQLGAEQARASRKSPPARAPASEKARASRKSPPAPAQAPAQAAAPAQAPAPASRRETAQELLARIQANPGRTYENVVMPTMDARSAPTATYQAPSGRGDLGGMVSGTGMQVQGGRTGVQDRRTVADNSARLQGLRRSIASGSPGQGSRFRQLGQVMRDSGTGSVNLTSPSGGNFNMSQGDVANQVQAFSPNLARPAVAAKSMGPATPAPQFNPSQGMMGNVMAQNRQVKSAPTQRMPNFPNFPSQQGATPTAVASKKPEYNPLASMTPAKDQRYALRSFGLR